MNNDDRDQDDSVSLTRYNRLMDLFLSREKNFSRKIYGWKRELRDNKTKLMESNQLFVMKNFTVQRSCVGDILDDFQEGRKRNEMATEIEKNQTIKMFYMKSLKL